MLPNTCQLCHWRRTLLFFAALTFVSAGLARGQSSESPFLALHPDNPHYFQWRGQPTILVTSGEHYGALLNLDFDYEKYFSELQRHGLNHTRTFSGVYREDANAFQITANTLAPLPNRYACPWARSDQPGYHVGGAATLSSPPFENDIALRVVNSEH